MSDIFKSSFLENVGSFSLIDAAIAMVIAFALGMFIFVIYKKTFTGVLYSNSFNVSLVALTMVTAVIIMGVSSNVTLSLGMVGALSIVRFRTAIKDPLDTMYIFWSIACGILSGAGLILIAIIGSIAIGVMLLLLINRITIENPYLLIIKYKNSEAEESVLTIVKSHSNKYNIKSKISNKDGYDETTYEIRVKHAEYSFVNEISKMEDVISAVLLSYDGNFAA